MIKGIFQSKCFLIFLIAIIVVTGCEAISGEKEGIHLSESGYFNSWLPDRPSSSFELLNDTTLSYEYLVCANGAQNIGHLIFYNDSAIPDLDSIISEVFGLGDKEISRFNDKAWSSSYPNEKSPFRLNDSLNFTKSEVLGYNWITIAPYKGESGKKMREASGFIPLKFVFDMEVITNSETDEWLLFSKCNDVIDTLHHGSGNEIRASHNKLESVEYVFRSNQGRTKRIILNPDQSLQIFNYGVIIPVSVDISGPATNAKSVLEVYFDENEGTMSFRIL
ncbi:MAG: hypothetical protein AAGC47_07760 [Bacteroidota bacterium]